MTTKLLLVLRPFAEDFKSVLPKEMMAVFPFYTGVSRLRYKPEVFDCKLVSDFIPSLVELPNHNFSFEEVCDKRATELMKIDGQIFVMWSGGIDSTTVITSILRNWPASDFSRVTVLCNTDSIKENKNFFPIIAKNFRTEVSSANLENFLKRGTVITGELGDQAFGSDIIGECVKIWGNESIHQSWEDIAPKVFVNLANMNGLPTDYGLTTFERYRPIVNEAPFKLKTVHDFFWWFNFSQKWQHVKLRTLMSKTWSNPKLYFPKILHFFDTVDFQVWSLHNQDKKIKDTWDSYKYTAKDYILSYTGDGEYNSKLKVPSLDSLFYGTEFHWGIDEEWNFLNKEETLKRMKNGQQ